MKIDIVSRQKGLYKGADAGKVRRIADFLGIGFDADLTDQAYVRKITEKILGEPESWLKSLPYYELELLRDLCRSDVKEGIRRPVTDTFYVLSDAEMVKGTKTSPEDGDISGTIRLTLHPDIHKVLSPMIEQYYNDMEESGLFEADYFVFGILATYGVISYASLHNTVKMQYNDYPELMQRALDLPAFKYVILGENLIPSPALEEEMYDILDARTKKGIEDGPLQEHKYRDLVSWGKYGPYFAPLLDRKNGQGMVTYLKWHGYNETTAPVAMHRFWIELQKPRNEKIGKDSLWRFFKDLKGVDYYGLSDFLELAQSYSDSVPRAYLYGASPADVLKNKPALNNMTASMSSSMSHLTQTTNAAQQFAGISGDDPCPCGSGKKYKDCHGKKLN